MKQRLIYTENVCQALTDVIEQIDGYDRLLVLTDENTRRLCWPLVNGCEALTNVNLITIPAGDQNKTLATVEYVWSCMQQAGATRHSLLVNLGGGMVTDLGGFAAATFKRGIRFVNVPTTLLAMVDASVGGKTGFNFGGLKNEIGVFCEAACVVIAPVFLKTIDQSNLLSGFAEMLKHALLDNDQHLATLLNADLSPHTSHLSPQSLRASIAVKERIVEADPTEKGLRKALNLGHTFGHAFEAFALQTDKPVLHGFAVASGLVCELYLSATKCGFPVDRLRQTVHYIHQNYGRMEFTCNDYPTLVQLMHHDKKNRGTDINVTLLSAVGSICIDQTVTKEEIEEALDFYREG